MLYIVNNSYQPSFFGLNLVSLSVSSQAPDQSHCFQLTFQNWSLKCNSQNAILNCPLTNAE